MHVSRLNDVDVVLLRVLKLFSFKKMIYFILIILQNVMIRLRRTLSHAYKGICFQTQRNGHGSTMGHPFVVLIWLFFSFLFFIMDIPHFKNIYYTITCYKTMKHLFAQNLSNCIARRSMFIHVCTNSQWLTMTHTAFCKFDKGVKPLIWTWV